ncbi:PTS sugar transporter subunit IIA [Paenibacillus sp. BSR1-1]|uniref:PTS sugar transporter subunit IIA n=1 Tax=Paenibacillus sp. BSR1-1 TaxID=3020845 RepID=UPI0025AEE03B|nr:PTS sugar transporter subunit IIA [Paenibacillus sp. BSR1-1]MDN3017944.1 PTS sugar transporter subunit IIA [Paenibacillus sp. BSR1-1]
MLKEYLYEDLVFFEKEYKDYEDLLSDIMKTLVSKNYVENEFKDALLEREKEFPTGLQLDGYAVAIPHGGSQYVLKDFISLVTLKNPIRMNRMDNPEESLEVDILFVIGFGKSETHLQCLKQLMGLIQDPKLIEDLKKGTSLISIL